MGSAAIPKLYALDIQAANGVPFRVLAIPAGVAGPNAFRAPADPGVRGHTVVEFWDRRYPQCDDPEHGQFTGGYFALETMLGSHAGDAMNLAGGVRDWLVDGANMTIVVTWLWELFRSGALDERE